jgi:uncharacterized damage-inducible protein DinB
MKRAQKKKTAPKGAKSRRAPTAMRSKALREQLAGLLGQSQAHANWREILSDIPEAQRGSKPAGAPYSAWQLLEHLRIAQWDILEFSRDARHVSPPWPSGYWPKTEAPPSATAWDASVKAFEKDLQEMKKLVSDPRTDLFARIQHGEGQTILREALLLADHNSYHLGQIVLLRKLLGAWPES